LYGVNTSLLCIGAFPAFQKYTVAAVTSLFEMVDPLSLLSGYFSRKLRNTIHNNTMQPLVSGTI
jgi:hypothetical protein